MLKHTNIVIIYFADSSLRSVIGLPLEQLRKNDNVSFRRKCVGCVSGIGLSGADPYEGHSDQQESEVEKLGLEVPFFKEDHGACE